MSKQIFERLQEEVIQPGLCTHCGTCVGLSDGALEMRLSGRGPLPAISPYHRPVLNEDAYLACPGKGINYPSLYQEIFGGLPDNWLVGHIRKIFTGYAGCLEVRRSGSSGGIITQVLLYLLSQGMVDGAVVLRHGWPQPWQSVPIIARTAAEIKAASQSVYVPTSVNTILGEMEKFEGRLAYVGLPDQIASLRRLQQLNHPGAMKVTIVIGPYVGTFFYLSAIESYLRSNGVNNLSQVSDLHYRTGDWPGCLQIVTRSGKVLKAQKFYYNYLIPFYITQSSLLGVDFTNELADISVGDAWHPRYESSAQRGENPGGIAVVLARSFQAEALLAQMQSIGELVLHETGLQDALSMHGHMLDFKKRGSFIRIAWRKVFHKPVPDYGYRPIDIPLSRYLVELVISGMIHLSQTTLARKLIEIIPLWIVGPIFAGVRKFWKSISKPAKRRGLSQTRFVVTK